MSFLFDSSMKCPQCGSQLFRPSAPRTFKERVGMLFLSQPVRCMKCYHRFSAGKGVRVAEPAAPAAPPVSAAPASPLSPMAAAPAVSPKPVAMPAPPPIPPAPLPETAVAAAVAAPVEQFDLPFLEDAPEEIEAPKTEPTPAPWDDPSFPRLRSEPVKQPMEVRKMILICASATAIAIAGAIGTFVVLRSHNSLPSFVTEASEPPSAPNIIARPVKLTTGSNDKKRVNPVDGLTYVFIPAGDFTMGCSPEDYDCAFDEKKPHPVHIANGFWLGQTEVTQAAWKRVNHGENPSYFKGDDLPVEGVDWSQAVAFCARVGGRLPTEQEWEYAARGRTETNRYGPIDEIAWFSGNSGGSTHPVGQRPPNKFELFDMLGNVWEWTSDTYSPGNKVVRGGSWVNGANVVRASYRERGEAGGKSVILGFRCAGSFN